MNFNQSAFSRNSRTRGNSPGALMSFWRAIVRAHRLVLALCLLLPLLFMQGVVSAADFAKSYGGDKASEVVHTGMAVDLSGSTYVSGYFSGLSADIGGVILNRIGYQDAFVAKLDPAGNTVWARNFGGPDAVANATSVALDGLGNVFVGGYVENGFNSVGLIDPILPKLGTEDAFAIKLDSAGFTSWARNFGGNGAYAQVNSIAVDAVGSVYLGGYLHTASLTTPMLPLMGIRDAFAIKLDSAGSTDWARNFGGPSSDMFGLSIANDGFGNVYLGGWMQGPGPLLPAMTRLGYSDGFAIKLDAVSGSVLWGNNFGGLNVFARVNSLAVDVAGNVYLAGQFSTNDMTVPPLSKMGAVDAFAIKLNSLDGSVNWAKNHGGGGVQTLATSIAADGSGSLYLSGIFAGANLDTPALPLIGLQDTFAFKLDAALGNTTWSRNFGGMGANAQANAIAVDFAGSVYLGGSFDSASLTVPALANIGLHDAFSMKLDTLGNSVWAVRYGNLNPGGNVFLLATALDGLGNTYVGGYFSDVTAHIGGFTLSRIGVEDAFVAKLDASGNAVWATNSGGSAASARATSIAVDGAGNVHVGGRFSGADLSTPSLTRIGMTDTFAIKLDPTGTTTWATNVGGAGAYASGNSIAVDGGGNVYLSGDLSGGDMTMPVLSKFGDSDAFAVKLDGTGIIAWGRNFGGSGAYVSRTRVAVDGTGNVYLGGSFGTADLTAPVLSRIGNADAFAIKLDAAGTTTWARNVGGANVYIDAGGVAVDSTGNAYLAGNFINANLTTPPMTLIGVMDLFAVKFDPAGTIVWGKNFGGSDAFALMNGIVVNGAGSVFLGGTIATGGIGDARVQAAVKSHAGRNSAQSDLTSPPLTNIGVSDAFAIRLDPNGDTTWAGNFGGPGANLSEISIAADNADNVYLGGYFSNANLSNPVLASLGGINGFIFKQAVLPSYTLSYTAGPNGSLTGISPQTVLAGASGSAVTAVPAPNHHFVNWSDTSVANPRIDINVTGNITVIANFAADTFSVSYDGNGSTGGSVPVDGAVYATGESVTVLGNAGTLTLSGYAFAGWNTAANGSGTIQPAASTFAMGTANVTLYAQWSQQPLNGVCGSAGGSTSVYAPQVNLCLSGTASGVTSASGTYGWSCAGANGGTSASCSANWQLTGTGSGQGSAAASGNGWIFASQGNGALQTAGFIPASGHPKSPPSLPPGLSFPQGLFDFVLITGTPGSSATIIITYPAAIPAGAVYWKFGPTPAGNNCSGAACATPHWYPFPALIAGNTVTLTIVDGGLGDDDLTINSVIVDQGGPAVAALPAGVASIPSLGEWGVILLAGLMGVFGLAGVRRRRLS